MIEIRDADRPDLVTVHVSDRLSRRDYEEMYEYLTEKTAEHGHVDLRMETERFGMTGLVSMWHGIVPDIRYHDRIKLGRVAVVGDDRGTRLSTVMWRTLNPVWPLHAHEIRFFPNADRRQALEWLDGSSSSRRAGDQPR